MMLAPVAAAKTITWLTAGSYLAAGAGISAGVIYAGNKISSLLSTSQEEELEKLAAERQSLTNTRLEQVAIDNQNLNLEAQILIRPPKKNDYEAEIALLMQSYQVQQSRLDQIAASWSENLWGYERGLIGLSVVATAVLVGSFSAAILVGSLFIGLSKLLTNHHSNDVARKERITKEITSTQKALDESLALINKHEIDFKETVINLKEQNKKLAADNAAIHQQTKNLTAENKRLHGLISIAEESIGELKEQQEHFANSAQLLSTEVQNFLSSGGKETTHLHKLLGTLIQEFSDHVKTLVNIKYQMLSTFKNCNEPQPEKPKEIDIAALAKQTNMIGEQKRKNNKPKVLAQNFEFEDKKIVMVNP